MIDYQPWMNHAACVGMHPDIFFPSDRGGSHQALKVCASCPVRPQCLARALHNNEPEGGVWGGVHFTKSRLRSLRHQRIGATK